MAQSLPFTSLSAATATGPGASKDLQGVLGQHTITLAATGDPTTVNVQLQGSHDGTNWFGLGTVNLESNPPHLTASSVWRYVRANLNTLTGGTSPTVTATIASS